MGVSLDIVDLKEWFGESSNKPMLIAGPCSVESEEQVFETARQINATGKVDIFRAGIWKPRTRPGTFEGVGEEGLKWLQQIKKETGLRLAIETATPEHVELCLKYGIDLIWIGARTTANPFSVQEIADVLKGTDMPVMIKNPVNPDLSQWIGTMERINKAGIKKIAAIHRGFFPFEETAFRNIPKWEIPIELKSKFHNLPIICDPSHIAGDAALIEDISQKALDMNMDGLMIETHYKPETALSDSNQQITPKHLNEIIENLHFRNSSPNNDEIQNKLQSIRNQIDSIDNQLLELLAQRMNLVKRIGAYKSEKNVAAFQLNRWEKVKERSINLARQLGLSPDFVKRILQMVHKESIQQQTEIMRKKK